MSCDTMPGSKVRQQVSQRNGSGRLSGWARRAGEPLLRLLFPPRCLGCEAEMANPADVVNLCHACHDRLAPAGWLGCPRCGAPVEGAVAGNSCPMCRGVRLWFDTVVTLGGYNGLLREVVLRIKRPAEEVLATTMGRALADVRRQPLEATESEVVIPVPMFWARRLRRGTNSPTMLAGCVGWALGLPVLEGALVRVRNTLPQPDLSPRQRFRNVRGAFRWLRGYDIHKARVLVVDDILTTGATASEIARVLKKAGASHVAVAVLARATGDHPA